MPRKPMKPDDDTEREELDRELDDELDDTFPASDPPKVTRVPRDSRITGGEEEEEDKHGR